MVTQRRKARPANVQVKAVPRIISDEEAFLLENSGDVRSIERFRDESNVGEAMIIHTHPGRVMMWKPGADGHYTPRTVSESSKALNLQNGWQIKCPDCNTNHEDSPYPPGDPNACPAREPVAFRVCPVCGKRITDNLITSQHDVPDDAPDAGMAIRDEVSVSTAESRTRVQLDRHLWQFHPRSAEMMGRPPLPSAARQYDGNTRPV